MHPHRDCISEYLYYQPDISEEYKAGLHHLNSKLDLVAASNFAWRTVISNMLMRRSIALDNLSRIIPPIHEDQKAALLQASFKGTTLFGCKLAKLQKANTERVSTLTVFLAPAATPQTYTTKPYTDHGKSFRKSGYYYQIGGRYRNYNLAKLQKANTERGNALTVFLAPAATPQTYTTKPYTYHGKSFRKSGYSYQIGGRYRNYNLAKLQKANTERGNTLTVFLAPAATPQTDTTKPYTGHDKFFRKGGYSYQKGGWYRDHDRSAPSATITKLSKSCDGQTTMTVTVPQQTQASEK